MKKMRKLIPAFAMLMVAAIMMTTASFAWFTMNDQVTATGMQIQAQASGSLVISSNPLQASDSDPSVDFESSIKQLTPIHLKKGEKTVITDGDNGPVESKVTAGIWEQPIDDAGQESVINPTIGTPDYRGLESVTPTASNYLEKAIYLGTSDVKDYKGGSITVSLTADSTSAGYATNAYSVAVYIAGVVTNPTKAATGSGWANDGLEAVAVDAEPFMILHVVEGSNTLNLDLPEDVVIPSIVGFEGEKATGLKIVLRIYVDGGLKTPDTVTRPVTTGGYTYTPVTDRTYDSEVIYWYADGYERVSESALRNAPAGKVLSSWLVKTTSVDGEGQTVETYTPVTANAQISTYADENGVVELYQVKYVQGDQGMLEENGTKVPANWCTRTADSINEPYHYVNNKDIPSTGTVLSVSFKYVAPTT